jgi:hypothetical protein
MKSNRPTVLLLGALGALALSGVAAGASARTTQSFTAHTHFSAEWSNIGCTQPPPQGADDQKCIGYTAAPLVSGLGPVSLSFTAWQTTVGNCVTLAVIDGSFVSSGKGTLHFGGTKPGCASTGSEGGGILKGQVPVAVTGGDGDFEGASGRGTLSLLSITASATGTDRHATGELTLALDLPNGSFDVTAPTITGAVPMRARAPKRSKLLRVTYRVAAQDAVDGHVTVACAPRPGSGFRIGRTRVTCTATDRSGNTATARFTITVVRGTR